MLQVDLSYDLSPNYDMSAYGEWARNSAGIIKKQPGMVDFRGHRMVFGTPRICTTSVWCRLEDWDQFSKSTGWLLLEEELRGFATNLMLNFQGH